MKADYQEENIGFYGDSVNGAEPNGTIILDTMWMWKSVNIATDTIAMAGFYGDVGNNKKVYTPSTEDAKIKCETPVLLLMPYGLLIWVLSWHSDRTQHLYCLVVSLLVNQPLDNQQVDHWISRIPGIGEFI